MRETLFMLFLAGAVVPVISGCGGAPSVDQPASTTPAAVVRLAPGDPVPDFSFTDQAGGSHTISSLRPRSVLATFIFTRCAMLEFCPRMSLKFQEMRQTLDQTPLKEAVTLVSITLDPEHDTPEALATYAKTFQAQPGSWSFARCDPGVLQSLKSRFGVRVEAAGPDGQIEHSLVTALIGPDGTVRRIWEGNGWSMEEVMAEIKANGSQPPAVAGTDPEG